MLKSNWRSIQSRRRSIALLYGGLERVFEFDPALATFTPYMDKRATSVFATSPIVQGKWDGSGTGDIVRTTSNPSAISNYFYNYIDAYQGSIELWFTPEWDGNDGIAHVIAVEASVAYIRISKLATNYLNFSVGGQAISTIDVSGWTAGTKYNLCFSWDTKNKIDGTNYVRVSINDSHTYGVTSAPTAAANILWTFGVNGTGGSSNADGIIEGFTVYRRVLFDGTYGTDVGNGDEINLIYNGATGKDPCLVTGGSWDIPFCLPTNSTAEALVSGAGEAWSHPHSSNLHEHGWMEDGGYLGDQWATVLDGNDSINYGSGATLDDILAGWPSITAEAWVRPSVDGIGLTSCIFSKDNSSNAGFRFGIRPQGLTSQIYSDAVSASTWNLSSPVIYDDKWHHIVFAFNTADNKVYHAIDGKWDTSYSSQIAATGNYVTDAALNLVAGKLSTSGSQYYRGAMGWQRLSSTLRYTPGTDFVPPRTMPAADGNTIEQWAMDDGSGATVTASVTSPGNDGTITGATWERQWDQFGSPVVPYSLEFDALVTKVNCGNAVDIQDMHNGTMTAELWARLDGWGENNVGMLLSKNTSWFADGWALYIQIGVGIKAAINCVTADGTNTYGGFKPDGKFHHIAMTWNNAVDNYPTIYIDGIAQSSATINRNGAIITDAGANLLIGNVVNDNYTIDGAVAWTRLSNIIRYTANFTPPSRLNPPAPDGNTLRQFNFRDGAGTTLTDATGTANGTITFGSGKWNTTPDMEIDAPGSRIYNWGYTLGADAVDEGIVEYYTGIAAGSNRVHRPVIRYENDHRAQPYVEAYDDTNGASISKFDMPRLNGTHDGGNNSATLSDSTAPNWPVSLVGATVYNITDGSKAMITSIAGNTVIAGALAGGTDNDWDNGDEYRIFPKTTWAFAETWTFELPTVARNGVAADCTAYSIRVANSNDEGVFYVLQMEQL